MKTFNFQVKCDSEFELEYAMRMALAHMEKTPDFYEKMKIEDDIRYNFQGDNACHMTRIQ